MILSVEHVSIRRGGRTIIDDLSLSLAAGDIVGVVGKNGCGKSTLLSCIAGVLPPRDGRITISGASVWGAHRERAAARRALGYVPEAADPPGFLLGLSACFLSRLSSRFLLRFETGLFLDLIQCLYAGTLTCRLSLRLAFFPFSLKLIPIRPLKNPPAMWQVIFPLTPVKTPIRPLEGSIPLQASVVQFTLVATSIRPDKRPPATILDRHPGDLIFFLFCFSFCQHRMWAGLCLQKIFLPPLKRSIFCGLASRFDKKPLSCRRV